MAVVEETPGGGQRPDDDGHDERRGKRRERDERRAGATAAPVAEPRFLFDGRGGPGPQVARRRGRRIAQRAELLALRLVGVRRRSGTPRSRRGGRRARRPRRLERPVEPLRAGPTGRGRAPWTSRPGGDARAEAHRAPRDDRFVVARASASASAAASASRSAASAWRRLSRARVRRARAATWLTPERRGELEAGQVVELGEEEGRALALRDPRERALHVAREVGVHHEVLGGRRGAVRSRRSTGGSGRSSAADLVEGDAVGDLVQPGPGVLRLLERVVVPVGLDERVLGQVGGELRVAQHPEQVGVDLAVVLGEQRPRRTPAASSLVPGAAHGAARARARPARAIAAVERARRSTTSGAPCGMGPERAAVCGARSSAQRRGHPPGVTPSVPRRGRASARCLRPGRPGRARREQLLDGVLGRDRVDRQAGAELEARRSRAGAGGSPSASGTSRRPARAAARCGGRGCRAVRRGSPRAAPRTWRSASAVGRDVGVASPGRSPPRGGAARSRPRTASARRTARRRRCRRPRQTSRSGRPDLVADEPAARALALADDEPGRAAELLGDPVRDLRQVVQVEAEVVGPGAGLGAPVLDDLEVVGLAGSARPRRGASRARAEQGLDRSRCRRRGAARCSPGGATIVRQLPRRPGLARGRPGRRPPSSSRASSLGADDVEREVLEHPDADAVARRQSSSSGSRRRSSTGSAARANRSRWKARSTIVATHQPVIGSLRSSNRPAAIAGPGERGSAEARRVARRPRRPIARGPASSTPIAREGLGERRPARSTSAVDGASAPPALARRSRSRRRRASRTASIRSKSARSTVHVEGDPVVADAALDAEAERADLARLAARPGRSSSRDGRRVGRRRRRTPRTSRPSPPRAPGRAAGAAGRAGDRREDRVGDELARAVVGDLAAALDPDDLDPAPVELGRRRPDVASRRRAVRGSGPARARGAAGGRRWRRAPARRRDASGGSTPRDTAAGRARRRRAVRSPASRSGAWRPEPGRGSTGDRPRPHDSREASRARRSVPEP